MLSYNYKIILTCQVVNSNCDHFSLSERKSVYLVDLCMKYKYIAIQKRKSRDVMYSHCLNYAMPIIYGAYSQQLKISTLEMNLLTMDLGGLVTQGWKLAFLVSTFSDELHYYSSYLIIFSRVSLVIPEICRIDGTVHNAIYDTGHLAF